MWSFAIWKRIVFKCLNIPLVAQVENAATLSFELPCCIKPSAERPGLSKLGALLFFFDSASSICIRAPAGPADYVCGSPSRCIRISSLSQEKQLKGIGNLPGCPHPGNKLSDNPNREDQICQGNGRDCLYFASFSPTIFLLLTRLNQQLINLSFSAHNRVLSF